MGAFLGGLRGVVWDWGDTLMRDIPGQKGAMADWPRVEAMPGALNALKALSAFPIRCVATNAQESDGPKVAEALARAGLRDHLTHFFASVEMGVSKPDPRFFLEVARLLRTPPERLLAVGNDLEKDILPARKAGMATVLVGPRDPASMGERADLTVSSLHELAWYFGAGPGPG